MSVEVFKVFRAFTPLVEGLSVDEAFLDVRGLKRHYESPVEIGQRIRSDIRAGLGLPASVGVASNKLLAKLASEVAKPDGLHHIPAGSQLEFLHRLPAGSLPGVGPATLAGLKRLGVETVGDVAETPEPALSRVLGPSLGSHMHRLANGIDTRAVEPDTEAKSISVEETYDVDLVGADLIETAVLAHSHRLSSRLHRSGLMARTVTLKARYGDFTTITRSHSLDKPVDGARDIYKAVAPMLADLDPDRPVRLLGLGGSSLEPSDHPRQMDLDRSEEWHRIEGAIAEVREKYGEKAVAPARLIDNDD